jgi:hypothetical protein
VTTRAERRREHRAANARPCPAPGIPPLRGSSGVRAKELFIQACETGEGHPYAGLSIAKIAEIESERKPVPNRAMARRFGIRSGYTRRLHARLAMAAEIKRADFIDADPARKLAHDTRRKLAAERAERRAARRAA